MSESLKPNPDAISIAIRDLLNEAKKAKGETHADLKVLDLVMQIEELKSGNRQQVILPSGIVIDSQGQVFRPRRRKEPHLSSNYITRTLAITMD